MSHANNFQEILKEQKLTIEKVSELTGVSLLALEYMLQDTLPKTYVAQKIAKVLDVPVQAIWPEIGAKKE